MDNKEKSLMPQEESALGRIVITESQVELIKHTVAVGATDDELKLFFFECRRRGVHPMDRLIHFVKRGQGNDAKATFQAGIDFMRSQAEASGEYRGQDDIEYGPMVKLSGTDVHAPEWAKATVKRRDPATGELILTSATAYWDEFYPGEKMGFMWRKMPRVMLGKTAESQALRKAFPRQLSGLYSFEEMEQADIVQTSERPPIAKPQEKAKTEAPSGTPTIIQIAESKPKVGKGPHKITDTNGTVYGTFSDTFFKDATESISSGASCKVTYDTNQYGHTLKTFEVVAMRQPGEDG